MTIQQDLEQAVATLVESLVVGDGNAFKGSLSQPQVEGSTRFAAVRVVSGSAQRLDHGQTEWTDTIALTIYWRVPLIDRSTRLTEWQAFADGLLSDRLLGGLISGLQDAYLVAYTWGDALDAAFVTMTAQIQTQRVE
tara:strand:+ start:695 stop:1105 length:411 start_codon:yes stop_codon:yes gene_type:complete